MPKTEPKAILPVLSPARKKLGYQLCTGQFFWRVQSGRQKAGTQAGYTDKNGYVHISVDGTLLLAHRLAWAFVYNKEPPPIIDHKDGNPSNNKWTNLRQASRSTNGANRGLDRDNSTGFKGVSTTAEGRFRARFRSKFLGSFDTAEEAALVYNTTALEHFGEFAKLNEVST